MLRRSPIVLSLLAGVAALLTVPACRDATAPASCGEARSLDSLLRIAPDTGTGTIDDQSAAIARWVPGGWGGFWLDSAGHPTVYLVHPEQRQDALADLYALGIGKPLYDVRTAQVRQGRWNFAQLYDWYRYINARWTDHVLGRALPLNGGVYSTDIDEVRNRLAYGVDTTAKADFGTFLSSLGLPCDLVTVFVTSPGIPL